MSYDIWGEVDTGGTDMHEVWAANHTSNTSGMWRAAGVDLAAWDGQPAADLAPVVHAAVEELRRNPQIYRRMDSPNGWGTYETTLAFLGRISACCMKHPKTTVRISR